MNRLAHLATALVTLSTLSGCYQALSAGYVHRFAAEGGPSFEGSYLVAFGDLSGEEAFAVFNKVPISGGAWGLRGADVIGVAFQPSIGDARVFVRPGLAPLVFGVETPKYRREAAWMGVGAELDLGVMFDLTEVARMEIGVRAGGDLSYTGTGRGGFIGAFIAFGSEFNGSDLFSN